MARTIAINGTRLDAVRMPLEPDGNGSVAYLSYPASQIRIALTGSRLILVVPAYLAVQLYRTGMLPQDGSIPVEVSLDGRPPGRYLVRDASYSHGNDSVLKVTFTLDRAPREIARHAAGAPRSDSAAAGDGAYVTDITHYLDETGAVARMPAPARKLASFLTLLIDAATGTASAHEHDSRIRCRAKACRGTIRTSLPTSQDEIAWHCPACGHHGVIRNWQNTKWNQLKRSEQPE